MHPCTNILVRLLGHNECLVLMFLTRILTTLAHQYNPIACLKISNPLLLICMRVWQSTSLTASSCKQVFGLTLGIPVGGLVQLLACFLGACFRSITCALFVCACVCVCVFVCVCACNQTDFQHLLHSGTAATTVAPLIDYYLGIIDSVGFAVVPGCIQQL